MVDFTFVPHTADIAIRVRGADLPTLLRAAALGLAAASLGCETLQPYRTHVPPRAVNSEGAPDDEGLLVTFLNELLFLSDVHGEVYPDVEIIQCNRDTGVQALAFPDPTRPPVHGIKAATYHALRIERVGDGLAATVVFDV